MGRGCSRRGPRATFRDGISSERRSAARPDVSTPHRTAPMRRSGDVERGGGRGRRRRQARLRAAHVLRHRAALRPAQPRPVAQHRQARGAARRCARWRWTARRDGAYLDLCAGTLDVGAMLVRQRGFDGRVVGADFAVPMLRHGHGQGAARPAGPGRRPMRSRCRWPTAAWTARSWPSASGTWPTSTPGCARCAACSSPGRGS